MAENGTSNINSSQMTSNQGSRRYTRKTDAIHSNLNKLEEQTGNIHEGQPREMQSPAVELE